MNCPSRTEDDLGHPEWNQSPRSLSAELTTRADLGDIANARRQRQSPSEDQNLAESEKRRPSEDIAEVPPASTRPLPPKDERLSETRPGPGSSRRARFFSSSPMCGPGQLLRRFASAFRKFGGFIGPGFMIAVAYVDPGNYATDVSAGAQTRFQLLFIVLLSNLFAILLQSLAIRLGTVTGMNLAEHCRANLPRWLNILLYILAEAAIIATDFAEVIGSAIALNLLLHIPLPAGCAITLVDVLFILLFYHPDGSIRQVRFFEFFVAGLVLAVVVCFCIQLSLIKATPVGDVFRGYLPSAAIVEGQGIYLSCGILGATVMPHSLYLGSGIVQSRLREFDRAAAPPTSTARTSTTSQSNADAVKPYRPSLAAIQHALNYSTLELTLALSGFALFVNSAILIVAGASLADEAADAADADLFGIANLLSTSISAAAATVFALALFFSGTSAGIVCTIAGQMVSEGQLNWRVAPWVRRLVTRAVSIVPGIVIASAVGRAGVSTALQASQVCLSVILPFVTAPLVWFTARERYMRVGGPRPRRRERGGEDEAGEDEAGVEGEGTGMRNHWAVTVLAVGVWLVITIMNVALLVLLALGVNG